jgi:tetratricopeptide (TPR) repeat protein
MPPPAKTLSPAELSALEHAFASDPASDAFRPLTEAYLAAGRFMEAMVVCKKGVKAHPDDPSARVLLARVYADQGKDRRGLEEIQAVLTAYPTFAAALRLAGVMHLRLGERSAGEAALRKAHEVSPDDPETRAALAQFNVAASAPPAAPPPSSAPVAPMPPPRMTTAMPAASMPAGATATASEVPTPTPPPGARERSVALSEQLAEQYKTREFTIVAGVKKPRNRRGTLVTTLALAAVLAVALGGWAYYAKARKERIEAIDRLIKETVPLLEKDTANAYGEAARKAEEILSKDAESIAGRAFLAYSDAILALEHGGGDAAKGVATAQVEAARKAQQRHSHLIAAEAYLKALGGDLAGAQETVKAVTEGEGSQSPVLQGALGAVLLRSGDLDAARDQLSPAQKSAPGDARLAWLLAEQFRRRGDGYDVPAIGLYDYALRIEKEHLGSTLGKGLVLLSRGQTEEAGKAADLVMAPNAGASRPQQALAMAIRAGVLAVQGKAAEATAAEAEAAKLDPTSADVPHLAGLRRMREGDAKGAAEAFQRAISMEPKRVMLYADLVRAQLAQEGGAKLAIDTVKKAIGRVGENPRLVLLLGDAYRAAGDADLAQGQYQKAIQLGGKFPDARVALARLYRAKTPPNVPGALVELNQAIDEYGQGGSGGAAAAYIEMAEAERARGAKPAVLQDLYEKALQRDPASCDALWGAGKAEYDARRPSDTAKARLETYAKLCARGPHAAEVAKLLGK